VGVVVVIVANPLAEGAAAAIFDVITLEPVS